MAREIERHASHTPTVALLHFERDIDYGLAFYRNQPSAHYDDLDQGVPEGEHVLVTRSNDQKSLDHHLAGRVYEPLFLYDTQGLAVYRVLSRTQVDRHELSISAARQGKSSKL